MTKRENPNLLPDLLTALFRHQVGPGEWHIYDDSPPQKTDGFILSSWAMNQYLRPYFNRRTKDDRIESKDLFAKWCQKHDLSHPHVFGLWPGQGKSSSSKVADTVLASRAEYIVAKARSGAHGDGLKILPTKNIKSSNKLENKLSNIAGGNDLVLQELISQHPHFSKPHPPSINTIRAVTFKHKNGSIEIDGTVWRIGYKGLRIDSWRRGGIAANVDPATGVAGPGCQLAADKGVIWYDRHPETTQTITGRQLPYWHDTIQLVQKAARAFKPQRWLGWDIAMTKNGPTLLEVNDGWALPIMAVHRGGTVPFSWVDRLEEAGAAHLASSRINLPRTILYLRTVAKRYYSRYITPNKS